MVTNWTWALLVTTSLWLWLAAVLLILANVWCWIPTRRSRALSLLVPAGLVMVLGHVRTFTAALFASVHCCTGRLVMEEFRVLFFELHSLRMTILILLFVPVLIRCRDRIRFPSGREYLSVAPLGIALLDGGVLIAAAFYGFGILP